MNRTASGTEVNPLELIEGEVVGTAKAARLLGFSEETVRRWCREGKLEGAFQPSGYDGKWLIPMRSLKRIRWRPAFP
jgi:hypothetical protein